MPARELHAWAAPAKARVDIEGQGSCCDEQHDCDRQTHVRLRSLESAIEALRARTSDLS